MQAVQHRQKSKPVIQQSTAQSLLRSLQAYTQWGTFGWESNQQREHSSQQHHNKADASGSKCEKKAQVNSSGQLFRQSQKGQPISDSKLLWQCHTDMHAT